MATQPEATSATVDTISQANSNGNIEDLESHETVMLITESSSKIHKSKEYKKAINDPIHGKRWREVIEDELQNLENYHTWKYKQLSLGRKAIGSKWIFKVKYNLNRSVSRFKTKLVAQSFSQVQGVDFTKTFTPMVRQESIEIYLAIYLIVNLIIHQVDIIGAYLESLLNDNKYPIFIRLPPDIYELCHI